MNIIISGSSDDPIYQQIIAQIKEMIFSGELKEGDPLPSIRNLAKDLQISVITTKRAYEELEKQGFIHSFTGKGSFVTLKNTNLLYENKMKALEDNVKEIVKESKILNLSMEQLIELVRLIGEDYEQ